MKARMPCAIAGAPRLACHQRIRAGARRNTRLCELSPGRHHRDPESERLETRGTHSAHERRGWHGLGAFLNEFSGSRHAVTPEWSANRKQLTPRGDKLAS